MPRERLFATTFPAPEWFKALEDAVDADQELAVVGRWCTIDLALGIGKETVLIRLRKGKVVETLLNPDIGASWDVTLRGTEEDWREFLQPVPRPFYTDLLAMSSRVPSFSIEGNRRAFVRHLRALSRIFAIAQSMGAGRA